MRVIIILLLTLGASSSALASDTDVTSEVESSTKVATVGEPAQRRGCLTTTRSRLKPLTLPDALSLIREIQDARDKRTGVETKHVQITYDQVINPPVRPHNCGGIKAPKKHVH